MSSLARYLDPDVIRQVSRLDMRARFIVEGFLAGLHRSPVHGLSVEFSEHRKYAAGDDLRTIDWSVFARTDRLFVRKYVAETQLACHLIVDASASMGAVGPWNAAADASDDTKLSYAIHIAAALGFLITRQQDSVGLAIIGDGLQGMLPPRARRADLAQLLAVLAGVRPQGPTQLAAGLHAALDRIPHRGIVVVLSDLLSDEKSVIEALHRVRHRGHDLIVMHILHRDEAAFPFSGALQLEDPETGRVMSVQADAVRDGYRAAIDRWRGDLHNQILAMRGDYVALDTGMPFDKALVEFLLQRARRR